MNQRIDWPQSFGRCLLTAISFHHHLNNCFSDAVIIQSRAAVRLNLGHCLKFTSWIGNGIRTNRRSFPVGWFIYLFIFSLWRAGSDSGCSLYLTNSYCYGWTVLQLMAGWDTDMPKNCWKLKDAELRCWTPVAPRAHGKLIAPDPTSALCCEWIPIECMLLGNLFIWSNFPFESNTGNIKEPFS